MKLARGLVSLSLIFSTALFSFIALPMTAHGQDTSKIALQRGYRTGYSDGYMAGYRDIIDGSDKNYTRHPEYAKADRAFNKDYGTIEDYKDGYQQGFESGYDTGFGKKSFDAAIPVNIGRRGMAQAKQPIVEPVKEPVAETQTAVSPVVESPAAAIDPPPAAPQPEPQRPTIQKVAYVASTDDPVIIIPRDTEIILELDEAMDTERNREGDKFTAKIVSPVEIAGARIEGHVDKVTKPGRIKRRSEMLLSFDRLVVNERRWTNFDAILTEVLPVKGDNVKTVDTEGTAIGKSSIKSDSLKIGVATGTGAGIGLFGGPVGMAVGAGVGAAFGVGAVVIERGKHIKLNQSQQLRIKTSYETQIR
ncbi:MAG TPA: hypothetical protein PLK77_14580 [Pyrinomonadaceae bacterium]|nr:hypothetical protein [Pyrinomonadaceae bacterium]